MIGLFNYVMINCSNSINTEYFCGCFLMTSDEQRNNKTN